MRRETLRIGGGAGFWGDTPEGPAQLVRRGGIDVLVLDYLAEITMSLLARLRAKDPAAGFAPDFVSLVMKPLLREIAAKGIRVVTNAGGVNPRACRDALAALCAEQGVALKIAVVLGDDLTPRVDGLRAMGLTEMATGAPLPARIASANAYLGAFPIAAALDAGADVVITGRCVDSALALGPLIHAFGWGPADFDRLSAGSLAGHVIECGTQCTGGLYTDWRQVPGWDDMGFPIAEVSADGAFVLTKPEGTGGLVTPATVAEQIVYEVGDPACYRLPDVTCDWRGVRLEQAGRDRVRVSGARGAAPSRQCKVSVTWPDGWRAAATMTIGGREAAAKARATGAAILARSARLIAAAGLPPLTETLVEVIGSEDLYGPHGRSAETREVVLRLAVRHPERTALEIFAREIYPAATAMAPGITGFAGGRPNPQPVVRLFSTLIDKAALAVTVEADGDSRAVPFETFGAGTPEAPPPVADPPLTGPFDTVPLIALAHGRSGDKGDIANIGLIARDPAFLPAIRAAVTPETVAARFAHLAAGAVERFDWPGLHAMNLVLHRALGGGGIASLRNDPQGKTYAQILLDAPVPVPAAWLAEGGPLHGWEGRA